MTIADLEAVLGALAPFAAPGSYLRLRAYRGMYDDYDFHHFLDAAVEAARANHPGHATGAESGNDDPVQAESYEYGLWDVNRALECGGFRPSNGQHLLEFGYALEATGLRPMTPEELRERYNEEYHAQHGRGAGSAVHVARPHVAR